MENTIIYVCDTCGSKEVEERCWRDCNTTETTGAGEAEYEDSWCRNCENNCNIITQKEYENKKCF